MKKNNTLYIVCDYYHEDSEINIDGVTSVYLEAIELFKNDINTFLHHYNCFLSETFNVIKYNDADKINIKLCTDKEHFATLTINGEIVCEWFIKEFNI